MIISIYDTYGAVAEGELLYKGEKVKYQIDGGSWGTVFAPIKNVDNFEEYTVVCHCIDYINI